MRFDSMMYTMGTALNHAFELGIPVRLLIRGEWVGGQVLAVDGHGVILGGEGGTHSVVKVSDISAVQVMSEAPVKERPGPADTRGLPPGDLPDPRREGGV